MSNLLGTLKKFFGNKNTVTILGIVAGVLVLIIGYNLRLKNNINPVVVPYAINELEGGQQITEKDIGYLKVSSSVVESSPNLLIEPSDVVNKYVTVGTKIPKNSLFYEKIVVDKKELPDAAFADIKDGYTIYSLSVDLHSTYGNSIYPDNYIDLYFKSSDEQGHVMYGKFIESIKVLDVKDDQGNHLFDDSTETREPAELLFAVEDDIYLLLMKAEYISGVEIVPVPRNSSYSQKAGDTVIASEQIVNYINSKTVVIPKDSSETEKTNDNEKNE